MALSDDDVKEILRLIDESDVSELRIETDGFSLHVIRGAAESTVHRPQSTDQSPVTSHQSPSANGATIDAPMLGTFYRAEAPGAAPFVDVGTKVDPDTTVCLIEVMKMMNPVTADAKGRVVDVLVADAHPVEYDQPQIAHEPLGRG